MKYAEWANAKDGAAALVAERNAARLAALIRFYESRHPELKFTKLTATEARAKYGARVFGKVQQSCAAN